MLLKSCFSLRPFREVSALPGPFQPMTQINTMPYKRTLLLNQPLKHLNIFV